MAKIIENNTPEFWKWSGSNWRETLDKQDVEIERLQKVSDNVNIDKTLINVLVRFQVADGYAYYLVINEYPLTLMHVPYLDAYRAHPALLRGLDKNDVRKQVKSRKMLKAFVKGDMQNENRIRYAK